MSLSPFATTPAMCDVLPAMYCGGSGDIGELVRERRLHRRVERSLDRVLERLRGDGLVRRRREAKAAADRERVALPVR